MRLLELKDQCTGCGACASVCPQSCIEMVMDSEGFYYPQVTESKCIGCGLCEKNCHCLHETCVETVRHSYYGYSNDPTIRVNSSSGGAFSALAEGFLHQGGNVYGAAFDYDRVQLIHTSTDCVPLEALRKSKYMESYMGTVIADIRQDLAQGRPVLFCGTPCQVAGVRQVIGNHELLCLCDFVCHGVPATGVFREYLTQRLGKNEKLLELDFRPGEYGWSDKYLKLTTNKRVYATPHYLDVYYKGFMTDNAFLRRSCYDCRYVQNRHSDITIADFWGYKHLDPAPATDDGLSLIVAHTPKGLYQVEGMKNFTLCPIDNELSAYAFKKRDYLQSLKTRAAFYEMKRQKGVKDTAIQLYMGNYFKKKLKYTVKKLLGREK